MGAVGSYYGSIEHFRLVAKNALGCLDIKEGQGDTLIIYADTREQKQVLTDHIEAVAHERGVPTATFWLEDIEREHGPENVEAIVEDLTGRSERFYGDREPLRRNMIDLTPAGRVREGFVKQACVKRVGAFVLSAPTTIVDPLLNLLGPGSNPDSAWERGERLTDRLSMASAYRIECRGASLELPWNAQDYGWVISVGKIKRQHARYGASNLGAWGNPGEEVFTSGDVENATGMLGFDGTLANYRVPDGGVLYVPVENGRAVVEYLASNQAQVLQRGRSFFEKLQSPQGPVRIAEIPAIALITSGLPSRGGDLENLEVEKYLSHVGFGDPEANRGTIRNPQLQWTYPTHDDMTMKTGTISGLINGKWEIFVDRGRLVDAYR
jgi:hypothetical protein